MPFKSKAQQRLCYARAQRRMNGSWDCGEWSKHTKKKLPMHKKKADEGPPLDEIAAFKAGFLLRALDEGWTPEEIVKNADALRERLEKDAGVVGDLFGKAVGTGMGLLGDAAYAGVVGAPLALGAGAGYGIGKLQNASETGDADEMKLQNRIAMYKRMAEDARRQAQLKKLQEQRPGEIVELG